MRRDSIPLARLGNRRATEGELAREFWAGLDDALDAGGDSAARVRDSLRELYRPAP
jgi:hypothetical protein